MRTRLGLIFLHTALHEIAVSLRPIQTVLGYGHADCYTGSGRPAASFHFRPAI